MISTVQEKETIIIVFNLKPSFHYTKTQNNCLQFKIKLSLYKDPEYLKFLYLPITSEVTSRD